MRTTLAKTFLDSYRVYLDRRVLSILFFGFSSGLPILLVYSVLSAWLSEAGVSKTAIGFASLIGFAYSFKVLWSPLVNGLPIPVLSRLLGQRRAWLLISQLAIIVSCIKISTTDPTTTEGLFYTILGAVMLSFSSATQDMAVDAYRTEILHESQLAAGAAINTFGYRIAMWIASAGGLIIAEFVSWNIAYLSMAGFAFVGIIATLINPEPQTPEKPKRTINFGNRYADWLQDNVLGPFWDFLTRPNWLLILAVIFLYRYADILLGVMAKPFYLEMGYTKTQIATISGTYGLIITFLGAAFAGLMVKILGIMRVMYIGAVLAAFSNLLYLLIVHVAQTELMYATVITFENFSAGIATTAFVAYFSFLCNRAFSVQQYALFTSLVQFGGKFFAAGGGWIAERFDWTVFFILTFLAGIPVLILLRFMIKKYHTDAVDSSDQRLQL